LQNAKIRIAEVDDARGIQAIYEPYVLETAITLTSQVPTLEQVAQTLLDTKRKYPYLVCCRNNRVLGFAFANRIHPHDAYNWNVELTIYISPQHQGRGIATALYTALFQLLRLQGFCNLYALITLPNEASIALHRHFGFRRVAVLERNGFKLGQWRDVLWLEYRLPNAADPAQHGNPVWPSQLNGNDVTTALAMASALLGGEQ
jgi:phosphinothricin acetyltransferase